MISIIIPVYNTAQYLDQCLESVFTQSYTDWECIVVDDGSTDRSPEICDEWGRKDSRFVIIHQKNQGVSAARNHGLEKSKGEYICFIDSDDWVESNYLSNMINSFDPKSADLVVTGTRHILNDYYSKSYLPSDNVIISLENKNTGVFIENVGLLYSPYSKLYKSSIIKDFNVIFPEDMSLGEDTTFVFTYLKQIRTIHFINVIGYNYRLMESNSLSSMYRDDKSIIRYKLWLIRYYFYDYKNMWNQVSQANMYRELWAIIYDGIFSVKAPSLSYLQELIRIREISELKGWTHVFNAPRWVKFGILRRWYMFFFLVRKIK